MAQLMHTVRFFVGMAMLVGGVMLSLPFAAAVIAARTPVADSPEPGAVAATPGTPTVASAMMIGTAGHAIPDVRQAECPAELGDPHVEGRAAQVSPPPPPPAPLPASALDWSPASPALDGTYRSTVDIPPPPLLDAHAPPPLAAGWSVHDLARRTAPIPAIQHAPAEFPQPAESPGAVEYVVRDGDDLTGIALKVYGHAGAATALWSANRDRLADPQVLPIGLSLRLPPSWTVPAANGLQGGGGSLAIEPRVTAVDGGDPSQRMVAGENGSAVRTAAEPFWLQEPAAPSSAPSATLTASPGYRSMPGGAAGPSAPQQRPATARVGMGDSLESIAVRFYGDRAMASRIWLANRDRLRSPELLVPGAELRLP
jgi:nucleoid-associated protein YgaU